MGVMIKMKTTSEEYMIGKQFGMLTVVERAEDRYNKGGYRLDTWKCRCVCGNEKITTGTNLRRGLTKSCGCIRKNCQNSRTHGKSNSRIYMCYNDMKRRCYDKKNIGYKNYGMRGIKVCDEWLGKNGFQNFYDWAIDNGYTDELTIERIDVNGNYEPYNCKWIANQQQARNKTNSRIVEYKGEKKCLKEWSEILGVPYSRLSDRLLKLGWSVERAFEQK